MSNHPITPPGLELHYSTVLDEYVPNLIPRGGRILIKPVQIQETSGGILIPQSSKDDLIRVSRVILVGEGFSDAPMQSKPGDYILHARIMGTSFSGTIRDEDGNSTTHTYAWMQDADVIASFSDASGIEFYVKNVLGYDFSEKFLGPLKS